MLGLLCLWFLFVYLLHCFWMLFNWFLVWLYLWYWCFILVLLYWLVGLLVALVFITVYWFVLGDACGVAAWCLLLAFDFACCFGYVILWWFCYLIGICWFAVYVVCAWERLFWWLFIIFVIVLIAHCIVCRYVFWFCLFCLSVFFKCVCLLFSLYFAVSSCVWASRVYYLR